MPAATGKLFIAIETGSGVLGDGTEFHFVRGKTKIREGHAALKRWPLFFVEDGTLESEWPTPGADHAIKLSEEADRKFREEQAKTEPRPIPIERRLRVITAFVSGLTGHGYAEGEIVDREDPAVAKVIKEAPQYFETLGRPLA